MNVLIPKLEHHVFDVSALVAQKRSEFVELSISKITVRYNLRNPKYNRKTLCDCRTDVFVSC